MGELFGKDKRTISEHIRNIFKEGELIEDMVVRKFRITTQHVAIEGQPLLSNRLKTRIKFTEAKLMQQFID